MSNRSSTSGKLILVVEDDQMNAEVVSTIIRQETPHLVRAASDGMEALQVQQIKPHLFLLDVELPTMNGLELYDRLHVLPGLERVPVLFLSASHLRAEVEARHLPLLEKPYELEALLSALEEALQFP